MTDDPKEEKLDLEEGKRQIEHLRQLGEKYYDAMYDDSTFYRGANPNYSDAKDCYYDAIGLAHRLGLNDLADELSARLAHIKAVFRSQFT